MLFASLRISLRRTLSNLRLTLAVAFGIVLAVTIMATTVVYFEALRDIALARSLARIEPAELDVQVGADLYTVNEESAAALGERIDDEVTGRVSGFANETYLTAQTRTFLIDEAPALVPIGECPCRPGGIATGPNDVPGRSSDGEIDPTASGSLLACDCRRANFSFVPEFDESVRVVDGRMPEVATGPAALGETLVVEALLDPLSAQAFGLSVGDILPVRPFWESDRQGMEVVVAGIYERNDPEAPYWAVQDGQFSDSTPGLAFARFITSEETFVGAIGPNYPNMTAEYVWLIDTAPGKIHATDTGYIRSALDEGAQSLRSELDGFRLRSGLQQALADFEVSLFFNRIPMLIVFALVVAVSLYYAAMVASTLIASQRSEIALMRSRGAARPQIFLVYVIEAATLALFALIVGPLLSMGIVSLIGKIPIYADLNDGVALPVQLTRNVILIAGIGAALGFLALLVPAYRSTGLNALSERRQRGRPGRLNVIQRYYLDLGLLGVVAAAFWQLTKQGSFVATDVFGETSVNNLALAAPALLLVMAGFTLLRLFPILTEGISRALASRVGSTVAPAPLFLGIRQLARNPGGYARLSLLLVISAALGVFAATFAATLERSARDQVLYETGAEFRATSVTHLSGRRSISAAVQLQQLEQVGDVASVLRVEGETDSQLALEAGERFDVLGVDTANMQEVAWYRADFLGGSMDDFLEPVTPDALPGIFLPPDTRYVSVRVKPFVRRADILVVGRFSDKNGRFYSVPFGNLSPVSTDANRFGCPLPDPGIEPTWCRLGSSIYPPPTGGIATLAPLQPVRLHSIGVVSASGDLDAGAILLDDIQVLNNIGQNPQIVESFDTLESWRTLEPTADALGDTLTFERAEDGSDMVGIARLQWTDAGGGEYRGLAFGASEPVIPAIVSENFAKTRGSDVGDVLTVSIDNVRIRMRVARITEYFPTLYDDEKSFAIFDQETLKARLNLARLASDTQPNEYWITTVPVDGEDAITAAQIKEQLGGLTSGTSFALRAGPVIDQEARLGEISVDPLMTTGWQALLGIAFVAVLIVSAAGYLIHARTSFLERRAELALFRTIGISRAQLLALITVEQVIVIGVAFAIGIFLGTRLGDTIFPFLAASGESGVLAPPMVIQIEGLGVGAVFGTLALVFACAIGVVLWSAARMAISSVMRAGDG